MEEPRCLIADPDPLTRFAIGNLVEGAFAVDAVSRRAEAVDLLRAVGGFEVIVFDYARCHTDDSECSGQKALREIRLIDPDVGVVAFARRPIRQTAAEALQAGATAFVSRAAEPAEWRTAIERAANQEQYLDSQLPPKRSRGPLTRRQRQILTSFADGRSPAQAAAALGVSEATVKTHTKHVLARLGARNRAHAIAIALRAGLID